MTNLKSVKQKLTLFNGRRVMTILNTSMCILLIIVTLHGCQGESHNEGIAEIPGPLKQFTVIPYTFTGKFLGNTTGIINNKTHSYSLWVTTERRFICRSIIQEKIKVNNMPWKKHLYLFPSIIYPSGCFPHNALTEKLVKNIPGGPDRFMVPVK